MSFKFKEGTIYIAGERSRVKEGVGAHEKWPKKKVWVKTTERKKLNDSERVRTRGN